MADETPAAGDQQQDQIQAESAPGQETESLGDAGKAALAEERKARRDAERQLKALRTQVSAYEESSKSDTQKATDRATAAEQEVATLRARYDALVTRAAVVDAAAAAKAIDPATIYALIRDDITIDDQGDPQGIDKAIAALVKSKPFLFSTTPAGSRDINAGGGKPTTLNGDALEAALRAAVGA